MKACNGSWKGKCLIMFGLLLSNGVAEAQDFIGTRGKINTEVTFYSPKIIRVMKYLTDDPDAKTDAKFVVTMKPQEVNPTVETVDNMTTIASADAMVKYNATTGQVSFFRTDGTPLVKEKSVGWAFTKRTSHTVDEYDVSQTFTLDRTEVIYGLGQIQDGNLNRRGCSYSHMAQSNMSVWIPYFHSVKGYGIYWDNYGVGSFKDANTSGTNYGTTFSSEGNHAIDYYVLVGSPDSGDEVVSRIRELTGAAPMVPLWSYGYFQSRERYTSADETLGVLKKYRSLGVPIDCVVQDWQYWGNHNMWNAQEFLNPTFSNYQQMIDGIHNNGGHLMISFWANFGRDTQQFAHFKQTGQLMMSGNNIMTNTYPGNEGVGIYNPYQASAREYYFHRLNSGLVSKGVDAYWMDSSEPDHYEGGEDWEKTNDFFVLKKAEEGDTDNATLNPLSLNANHTWRSVRNAFPLVHAGGVYDGHRALASGSPASDKRVMIMTRSAFMGMQRYGAGTWSGDVTASWETLERQIAAALSFSACGLPSWNSDIGGFFNNSLWPKGAGTQGYDELYARWIQFGAFCTIMRSHGSGTDRAIYCFGNAGQPYYDNIARYINLRYALLPYIYSTARGVTAEGLSFMRAMGLAFPSDTKTHALKDQFMFGQDMLIAPVLKEGAESRILYLPSDGDTKWVDIWTGESCDGGQYVKKAVDLATMPIYVRAGAILPWGPKVQYANEKQWNDLEIRVYPGADGSFTLYEDEGDGYGYEQGQFTEIPFTWDDASHTLTIGNRRGSFANMPSSRSFRLVLVDAEGKMGIGAAQSACFSKIVEYDGTSQSVQLSRQDRTEVVAPRIKSVAVESESITMCIGDNSTISAKAVYEDGTFEYVTLTANYESSDSTILVVRNGVIVAYEENGEATVKVSYTDAYGTTASAQVNVVVKVPSPLYEYKAYDWYRYRVEDRVGSQDISYSSKNNTITITRTGAQNIALRYNSVKYLVPGIKYLVAVATDVSVKPEDSQLWHLNDAHVGIVNATYTTKLADGRVVVAWEISETTTYAKTGNTIFGMTSTSSTGRSVISYVGYTKDIKEFVREMNEQITPVDAVLPDANPTKDETYSLSGTKLPSDAKGIVVRNRHKYLVK